MIHCNVIIMTTNMSFIVLNKNHHFVAEDSYVEDVEHVDFLLCTFLTTKEINLKILIAEERMAVMGACEWRD